MINFRLIHLAFIAIYQPLGKHFIKYLLFIVQHLAQEIVNSNDTHKLFIFKSKKVPSFVLGSLELIAEEIEEPFGKDANDLPMQRMSENIKRNVEEILAN